MRRQLHSELQYLYKDRNLIFTQFSKKSDIFHIRKWRPKEEENKKSDKKDSKDKNDEKDKEEKQSS